MAYTLTDPFRTLRSILRLSGSTLLLMGLGLLFLPKDNMAGLGIAPNDAGWPLRLAGALLVTLAVYYFLAANERSITTTALVTMMVGNGLLALVLLASYLQRELHGLSLVGSILLVILFIIFLICAVAPLRYLRAEFRTE